MRRIYLAKRIAPTDDPRETLQLRADMTLDEVRAVYRDTVIDKGNWIHNGHWIMRPRLKDGTLDTQKLPPCITPLSVWQMCKDKIDTSDAFVAVLQPEAYGAVAEAGYACGTGKIALYTLIDPACATDEVYREMWFVFEMALATKHLWKDEDIANVPCFAGQGIFDSMQYEQHVLSLIPTFLRRS